MFNPYTEGQSPFIIAEVGINHNGDVSVAKKLIDVAVDAGCDAVKFQKRNIDVVYTQDYLDGPRESPWGTTQRAQKQGLEFTLEDYQEIDRYCKASGIMWTASAWDDDSQDFLNKLNVPFNKVASAMVTKPDFLKKVAKEGKHTFVSTGMCTMETIDEAVKIFKSAGCPFTLFHTVSVYPCNDSDCNVNMITTLIDRYDCPVGYSGHERGLLPSILSVSLGATAIERHITLDRTMYGSDQSASLEPEGLRRLVRDTRNTMATLGTGQKTYSSDERAVATKLRYFESE
ncbi:N-acetylneuraminate synthase family protein [bacterium]|nr:N-acetylneuraminate synthase family protein [bacterium]